MEVRPLRYTRRRQPPLQREHRASKGTDGMRELGLWLTLAALAGCAAGCAGRQPFETAGVIQPADIRGLSLRGGVLTGLDDHCLYCQKRCEGCGYLLPAVVRCRKPRFRRERWGKSTRFACPLCERHTTQVIQVRPQTDPLDDTGR